jgi:YD repeat-containing protein
LQGWLKAVNNLMPLRNAVTCPAGTALDELTINDRNENDAPIVYKAKTSIDFDEGFESYTNDEFETIIDPNAAACTLTGAVSDTMDMGGDGSLVAKDAYGFTLHYFDESNNHDYAAIGTTQSFANALPSGFTSLYNGNIAAININLPKAGSPLMYAYKYDQLNRLISMNAYNGFNPEDNSWKPIDDYKENISYDANGNIKSYLRNGTGANINLNNYSYTYLAGTNKLQSITNAVNGQTKTYNYDAIGNTATDNMQGVSNAVWNVYGKLQSATNKNGQNITYTYSADGQRISKKVGNIEEWYVRDAAGDNLATYTKDVATNNNNLTLTEQYKYGSSLLDVKDAKINVESPLADDVIKTFERGNDNYILADGNGNTEATISDKKIQYSEDGFNVAYYNTDVRTATLHSSFGANAKTYNGGFVAANFNRQRKSLEIGVDAQTAQFWEYNGDVGRRWNSDPLPNMEVSSYSAFMNNPNLFSDINGDTVILGKDLLQNKYWMDAYKTFSSSKQGKEFLKDYGINGKYEKIAVTLNTKEIYWAAGTTDPYSVNPNNMNDAIPIRAAGDASPNTISRVRPGDQLKFTILLNWDRIDEKNVKNDPESSLSFISKIYRGQTILHETQHVRIFTKELVDSKLKRAVSTATMQHQLMKDPTKQYFKDRYEFLDQNLSPVKFALQLFFNKEEINKNYKNELTTIANGFDN